MAWGSHPHTCLTLHPVLSSCHLALALVLLYLNCCSLSCSGVVFCFFSQQSGHPCHQHPLYPRIVCLSYEMPYTRKGPNLVSLPWLKRCLRSLLVSLIQQVVHTYPGVHLAFHLVFEQRPWVFSPLWGVTGVILNLWSMGQGFADPAGIKGHCIQTQH